MSLHLDKRQRAMLREMGVRVWSPLEPAAPETVQVPGAEEPRLAAVAAMPVQAVATAAEAPAARARPAAAVPAAAPAPQAAARMPGDAMAWEVGELVPLYAGATAPAAGPRWLVLAETPASALQGSFNPFDGDAGKLLDNMLRAARLDKGATVMLAPLSRQGGGDRALADALPGVVSQSRPDLVLVMGRLAAQALLQSGEPLGKLRGQVHSLHGVKLVVTVDAPYLLRNPLDKAKAWEDLCLAMSIVSAG